MGATCNCNCLNKKDGENFEEMLDGHMPEYNKDENQEQLDSIKQVMEQDINLFSSRNNENNVNFKGNQQLMQGDQSIESEQISVAEERNENLFEFFNDIRMHPQNYIDQAKDYNLEQLLTDASEAIEFPNNLIKNGFYNLLLDSFIKKNNGVEDELFNSIDNATEFEKFRKKLYIVEAPVSKVEEAVWNLLMSKKETALRNILQRKIDYCVLTTCPIKGSINLKAYFLFLTKAN